MARILITGVARGIGRALAEAALARGHEVVGTTRDGAAPFAHPQLSMLALDVRDEASVRAAAARLDKPVDVLINNAGVHGPRGQALASLPSATLMEVLDVNVGGPFRVLQAFLPHLNRGETPRVLMISSGMGRMSAPGSGSVAYRASKAALNKMVQALHGELSPAGVAVVACHPGWVRTDMGGQGADIAPEESAAGLLALAEGLTVERAGRFYDWKGREQPW